MHGGRANPLMDRKVVVVVAVVTLTTAAGCNVV